MAHSIESTRFVMAGKRTSTHREVPNRQHGCWLKLEMVVECALAGQCTALTLAVHPLLSIAA